MSQIITIAQQKGGAGKTTIAAHIAVCLMQTGRRVALIDIDPQGSLTHWYGLREKKYGTGYTGIIFHSIPGWRLSSVISQIKDKFDFIVIDSPPHTESETKAAIRAADMVLVPMQPTPTDLWATSVAIEFAKQEKKITKIVLNRYNPSSKVAKEVIKNLKDIEKAYLGNRVAFSSCFLTGGCVTELDPASQAAHEVQQLVGSILVQLGHRNENLLVEKDAVLA